MRCERVRRPRNTGVGWTPVRQGGHIDDVLEVAHVRSLCPHHHRPTPPTARPGFEHLAPLFVERAALPDDDPRRERLRDELIAGHLQLARNIARRFAHRGDHPEDVEQVAAVGLVLAVDRFDPARGIDFLSFAVPTITGEVLRYFRDRAHPIRTPRRIRAAAVDGVRRGRRADPAPRPRAAAQRDRGTSRLWRSRPCWRRCPRRASRTRSRWTSRLSTATTEATGCASTTSLARVEEDYDLVEHREALAPLLDALPSRERRILVLRFFGGLTQTEIGAQMGISQMHVSRLLSRTLTRLRRELAAD